MTGRDPRAWDKFWATEQTRGGGGCLPGRSPAIEAAQRRAWQAFAIKLPRNATVLDLATGDGRVMAWMFDARSDLGLLGVDLAPRIPVAPKGTKSRGGIAMEALPFAADRYDAVTSQFGIEYGDLDAVLAETARILRPQGKAAYMTHRLAGPLVAHNRARREGLRWVADDQRLIEKARNGLALRAFGVAIPPQIASAPDEAARRFGPGSGAWELAEAIRQTLDHGRTDHPAAVLTLLSDLESKVRDEIGRLDALEAAAQAVGDGAAFVARAQRHGLSPVFEGPVTENARTLAIADFRIFLKS